MREPVYQNEKVKTNCTPYVVQSSIGSFSALGYVLGSIELMMLSMAVAWLVTVVTLVSSLVVKASFFAGQPIRTAMGVVIGVNFVCLSLLCCLITGTAYIFAALTLWKRRQRALKPYTFNA